ncbi:MAG TPA: hypothetical protein VKT74_02905 [Gammaproteobacteria bacterium]|nr:hypothetical protein [Gammaproteobacteria bacterium]
MARDDWFRNKEWNETIASSFEEKLKRARRKSEYLFIQASTLIPTHPQVAIELIERYFSTGDHFRDAGAHVCRAEAMLALERIEAAIVSYEAALRREAEFPNLLTNAYIEYPYLIAVRQLESHFERALEILDQRRREVMFPVELFKWHAAKALILASRGNKVESARQAQLALDAAMQRKSWAQNHSELGLVSYEYQTVIERLRQLVAVPH